MKDDIFEIKFTLNGVQKQVAVPRKQNLLDLLRELSVYSVKRGCDDQGDCGMCTVLLDGVPFKSCLKWARNIDGHEVLTVEALNRADKPHPIQQAFMETGAIQCGYCTPAMILRTKALLDSKPDPTVDEVRDALSEVECRCTGFVKILDAVRRAGILLRGEDVPPVEVIEKVLPENTAGIKLPEPYYRRDGSMWPLPPLVFTPPEMSKTDFIGKPQVKVDARKLAEGQPVFTSDMKLKDMLHAVLLTSPYAHARIKDIDARVARALPGVHAVLTHKDLPRIKYSTGGQSYPQLPPYDQVSLDDKVRHVGDRVAIVAAETLAIARQAAKLIEVDYEVLPAVFGLEETMQDGAPVIHDEPDTEGIYDTEHNIIYHIEEEQGDVTLAFSTADIVLEGEFKTPKQHHAQTEPHACLTYWDEERRLVVRSSTQVPFHVRRIIAPLIGLPVKQIRVIKPRIGGGFGGKQEVILEDMCAHLTIATGRPVHMEYTRKQEFISGRSRHRQIIRFKVGVKDDMVTAIDLRLIGDTGAYATQGLTVNMVGAFKGLTLYNPINSRLLCDVVYTNTPPAGAFRGYGAMQEQFAIEVLMEEVAEKLALDVVQFKRDNWLKVGEPMYLARKLGEGREGIDQVMNTSGMEQCVDIGLEATDFYTRRATYEKADGTIKKGIGMAVVHHGSGIAGLDMASATLKMNDDGSFNLLLGASDIGTGSDTILAQIAAEVLNIPVEDFIVYSSDTDFTPFDKGAYASSTTYISGGAVRKAALKIHDQIRAQAAAMLEIDPGPLTLKDRKVFAPDGTFVTFEEVGLSSLHQQNQHQIMATASHMSTESPPPTAAQFAELEVNTETGEIKVERLLAVVDCGRVINPITAAGQVEGGMIQGLGFAHTEETIFDEKGDTVNASFRTYGTYKANETPHMDVIFVQTDEPSGPYGAKSVSEIAIDGVAPAMVSAVHNACGIWLHEMPMIPERVLEALQEAKSSS